MDVPFSNDPIAVDHLPRLDDDAFVSVDRRYVWGGLAGIAIVILIVVALAGLIVWRSDTVVVPVALATGLVVLLVAIAGAALIESRRLAYQLRERDLSLRSGAFRHRVETIPLSRIQHVSVGRGVLERSLGLATLKVSSAGPDFAVPGLSPADAERIKAAIAERAALESEVGDGLGRDGPHAEAPSPSDAPTPSSPPSSPPASPPAPPWPAP